MNSQAERFEILVDSKLHADLERAATVDRLSKTHDSNHGDAAGKVYLLFGDDFTHAAAAASIHG